MAERSEDFLPLLRRSPAGRIVNVSSRMGFPRPDSAASGTFVDALGPVPW